MLVPTDDCHHPKIRGKSGVKKFENEVAFARNYLDYDGFIDYSVRGIWTLTEKGRTAPHYVNLSKQ
ncbi:winged helix-turn-helix domain-containing protein [Neobacillus niacini]|uniref:winged helix-turn-helix domain-containing protein n=1 Tax=Neobacillus niacini TaxID=86668 RepID=UPI003B58B268